MKTNRHILLVLVAMALMFSACEKVLEIEQEMNIPADKAITSYRDLENVLTGAYDGLQSGNVMAGNLMVYGELLADDAKVDVSKLTPFNTQEIYERRTTVQLNSLRSSWRDAYQAINRANIVIDVVDNNKLNDPEFAKNKDRIKAEALFIRAIVHFELVRFWALPYNVETPGANNQLGVPYRKIPTTNGLEPEKLAMARNTVEEVYNYVIDDLKTAESLFAQAGVETSLKRSSRWACAAYLARVYFFKGDYANASAYADKVIKSGKYQLNTTDNIAKAFQTSGYSSTDESVKQEVIMQLVNTASDQSNAIAYNYAVNSASAMFQGLDTLKYIFSKNDKRRTKFLSVNTFTNTIYVKKYVVANPAHNICLIRLAEMYLIKAESDILSNNITQDTWNCYNTLKARAFGSAWQVETILQSNLLDSVRMERRREMIFENDRYHNLKRMHQPLRDGVPWNDPSLIFKIPQEEMSGNSLMVQNP